MVVQEIERQTASLVYESNYQHLEDELQKLDLMIQLRITKLRLKMQKTGIEANPGLSISHEEVDWLLNGDEPSVVDSLDMADIRHRLEMLQTRINQRVMVSIQHGIFLALPHLAHLFDLSSLESQAVAICLAPELHRKYDKLYAYLQDDITRMKPSVDLILELLCESQADRWQAGALLSEHSPLFGAGILHKVDGPQSPSGSSGLAQFLKLDQRMVDYILGRNSDGKGLHGLVQFFAPSPVLNSVPVDEAVKSNLLNLVQYQFTERDIHPRRLVLYLYGPYGVGKHDLALGLCGQLNCPLLYLDMEILLAHEADLGTLLRLVLREGLLSKAALYFDNVDVLLKEEGRARTLMKKVAEVVKEYGWLTFLAGEKTWLCKGMFDQAAFHSVALSIPDVTIREAVWQQVLERLVPDLDPSWAELLAAQFRLTPGQIHDAAEFAESQYAMNGRREISTADLYAACRYQSNQALGELAVKIEPRYDWEDIVLPANKLTQLKEVCHQVKERYGLLKRWGFDRKLARDKGISVLFSGSSGTGKTMAAEVIAHELQLDLYKIDLSQVVSKYIGETEKNMARIFDEAETSNAILFFDEADAVFGKRTDVSDAHDRYANIETSYLLQKIEEYEGVVILATNLRSNIDDAFTRRIRLIVDFPSPDAERRMKIWKVHFPTATPMSDDIDCEFLAKEFQLEGGSIKNIVVNAAFLAYRNGGVINMEHLLHGTRLEYEKIGKLWNEPKIPEPKE